MIDADRLRSGLHRVVELYNPATKQFGTGYGVTDRMVLTAAHVVEGAASVEARPLCDTSGRVGGGWCPAHQRWSSRELDAALLELPDRPWVDAPDRGLARWAKIGDSVSCLTRGFPWLEGYEDHGTVRDATSARGRVAPDSAVKRGRLTVDVDTTPLPRPLGELSSPWGGMSGAALLSDPGRELLGVVVEHASRCAPGRLLAVPAAELLRDADFARLVMADLTDLRPIVAIPSAAVTDLIASPYRALPENPVEWQLLMPAHRVVPFRGRDAELQQLRDWCHGDDLIDIAVVVGDGGAGKSRLAAQLCAEVADAGWCAGGADLAGIGGALGGELVLPAPALITVDYGEQSGTTIAELITRFGHRRRGPRLRLLLLARDGADGDPRTTVWWRRLHALTNGLIDERTRLVINLRSARWPVEERELQFYAARHAFAPYTGAATTPAPVLSADQYDNVLLVHIAALLPNENAAPARDHLLTQLLAREQARWLAVPHDPAVSAVLPEVAVQLITCITLTAPGVDELETLLPAVPGLAGDSAHQRGLRSDLARWLLTLTPGGEPVPLSPDILVEQLLAETPALDELVVGIHRNAACDAECASRMLAALLLAAPNRPGVAEAVSALLRVRLPELVAQALAEPARMLANLLVDALGYVSADEAFICLAAEVARTVPCPGSSLAGLGAALASPAVPPTPVLTVALTELATDLATWQLELDRVEQAEVTARMAVRAYQRLANAAGQARASRLLATCQARTGQTAQALATVRHTVHQLAEFSDDPAGRHTLATAMAEAAVWALRSSRPLEAAGWLVDAIHTVQQVLLIEPAGQRVDPAVDLAELGSRVDALRLAFVASGSSELAHAAPLPPGRITQVDTTEPVDLIVIAGGALIEALTAHSDTLRSDQVPVYAESLDALVSCLLRLGQYDAAFHALDGAVDRYRELSATDPGRYRPRLADTLRQRGLLLGPEERLPDAREAVAIYQELCRHDPATYLPELGDAWAKVGIVYEQLVQPTETLAAYREAAACYRQLDERFASELAQTRGSIATALLALGRLDDAATELVTALPGVEAHDPVSAARLRLALSHCRAMLGQDFLPDLWRAIELARQQAAGDPDATDDLAAALSMASGLLLAAGSPDEAHECAAEAVVLTRELIEQGMCDASELADALARLARTSIMRGQLVQADELSAEAITVARPELTADPGARTLVALALGVRCAALVQLGRHAEVLDPAREAIGYLRDLVTQVPADFGQLLEVMNLYATSLNVVGRPAEARDVLREVAGIADRFPAEFDAPFATRMATIGTLVDTLSLLGHYEEAFSSAQAAASDAVDTPFEPQCQFALAAAEHVHGQDRATYGRYTDAEALLSACVNRLIELHAQQTQLTPFVEQRLLACGPVLGQVLRWLGRNTEAEIFEARIATITPQMELP